MSTRAKSTVILSDDASHAGGFSGHVTKSLGAMTARRHRSTSIPVG
jgi:hypothetical protein